MASVNTYLSALKSKKIPETKIYSSKRKEILKAQKKKCARCKRPLKEFYYKFAKNPETKEQEAVCSDCLITIPERK